MTSEVLMSPYPARLRLRNTEFVSVRSEEEVFDILGLPFIEPRWRNADM